MKKFITMETLVFVVAFVSLVSLSVSVFAVRMAARSTQAVVQTFPVVAQPTTAPTETPEATKAGSKKAAPTKVPPTQAPGEE